MFHCYSLLRILFRKDDPTLNFIVEPNVWFIVALPGQFTTIRIGVKPNLLVQVCNESQ